MIVLFGFGLLLLGLLTAPLSIYGKNIRPKLMLLSLSGACFFGMLVGYLVSKTLPLEQRVLAVSLSGAGLPALFFLISLPRRFQ